MAVMDTAMPAVRRCSCKEGGIVSSRAAFHAAIKRCPNSIRETSFRILSGDVLSPVLLNCHLHRQKILL